MSEPLKELISAWRQKAMDLDRVHATMGSGWWQCAKELEAALKAAGSDPPNPRDLQRFGLHIIEKSRDGEYWGADIKEEPHPDGEWVRYADVAPLLKGGGPCVDRPAPQPVEREQRLQPIDLASADRSDPIVMAADAAKGLCILRIKKAIEATTRLRAMPLNAEECITILEHMTWEDFPLPAAPAVSSPVAPKEP